MILNSSDPPLLARLYGQLLEWQIDTEEANWGTLANHGGGAAPAFPNVDICTLAT